MMRTAIVIGATGLVGRALTEKLLDDQRFSSVKVFSRRSTGLQHPKLSERIIDFNEPSSWRQDVLGNVLFSTLGTTLKQAGSKEAQYKIDHGFQYGFAEAAAANGVDTYVLVSSAGASERSVIFYSRMKGELERDIKKLPFRSIHILRPGLLAGEREQNRSGEKIGFRILTALNKAGILKKYGPVHANQVAAAMISAALKTDPGIHAWTQEQLSGLSGS